MRVIVFPHPAVVIIAVLIAPMLAASRLPAAVPVVAIRAIAADWRRVGRSDEPDLTALRGCKEECVSRRFETKENDVWCVERRPL